MGSRRAATVARVFGHSESTDRARSRLETAIENRDEVGILEAGRELVSGSSRFAEFTYYSSLLDGLLARLIQAKKQYSLPEVDRLARAEWKRIKRDQKVRPPKYVTEAVIDSVKKAYREGGS